MRFLPHFIHKYCVKEMCLVPLRMIKANKDDIAFLKSTLMYEGCEPFVAKNKGLHSANSGMENIHKKQAIGSEYI